jgi:transcriptional regulator with XRE-family HTH domain
MTESIGERIKGLRAQQGMTLAELGEKVNLSTSYLSQVERDRTTPSLATLTAIARVLNVGLRYFFETPVEPVCIVRAESYRNGDTPDGAVQQRCLTPESASNKLTVRRIALRPHASYGDLTTFTGDELVFVLTGELKVVVGEEMFVLGTGDSVHYDASQPHRWSNDGDEPCLLIWSQALAVLER